MFDDSMALERHKIIYQIWISRYGLQQGTKHDFIRRETPSISIVCNRYDLERKPDNAWCVGDNAVLDNGPCVLRFLRMACAEYTHARPSSSAPRLTVCSVSRISFSSLSELPPDPSPPSICCSCPVAQTSNLFSPPRLPRYPSRLPPTPSRRPHDPLHSQQLLLPRLLASRRCPCWAA